MLVVCGLSIGLLLSAMSAKALPEPFLVGMFGCWVEKKLKHLSKGCPGFPDD